MDNILVTGGAGYVGSFAARELVRRGYNVWVYDNLVRGHSEAVYRSSKLLRWQLVVGDLRNTRLLVSTLKDKKIDAVMHFAALAYVEESVKDPEKYYENNVAGTLSLLGAMREVGVNQIIFSSSCATYGIPKSIPITEKEEQVPVNPYGYTKLFMERAIDHYARAYGFSYIILRYFNAAGASGELGEDHEPETHLIPLVLQVALDQRPRVFIYGDNYQTRDGTCIRDYIHVDDLASAHVAALRKLQPNTSLALNLGTGQGTTVKEIIETCQFVAGREIPHTIEVRRDGDPPVLVADSSFACSVLGWQPKYTGIIPIIESAWEWHRKNPKGFTE